MYTLKRCGPLAFLVVTAVSGCPFSPFDSGNDTDLTLTLDGAVTSHQDVTGDGTQVTCDDDGHIAYDGAPATPTLAIRVAFPSGADPGDTFALGTSPPPPDLVVEVDIDGAAQTILRGTLTVRDNDLDEGSVAVAFVDAGDNAGFRLDGLLDCDGFSFDDGDADVDSDSD